jgi:CheY-like chemotaxis protein
MAVYYSAKVAGQPYTAVVLDLTVPGGMGGREIIAPLHAMDPHVKAIVSSGYSEGSVMANFRQYGFSGVLAKPYSMTELSEVLRRVLAE